MAKEDDRRIDNNTPDKITEQNITPLQDNITQQYTKPTSAEIFKNISGVKTGWQILQGLTRTLSRMQWKG